MCTICKFSKPRIPTGSLFHMHFSWCSSININVFICVKYLSCPSLSGVNSLRSNKCSKFWHFSMLIFWSLFALFIKIDKKLASLWSQYFIESFSKFLKCEGRMSSIAFLNSSLSLIEYSSIVENRSYKILHSIFVILTYFYTHSFM